jgi:hypothetical protein
MKSIFKYIPVLLGVVSFGLSGCLKDGDFDKGQIQSVHSPGTQKIIEIKLSATSSGNFLQQSFNAMNADTTFDLIPVFLASGEAASEDINVTLVQDTALVTAYNDANGTSLVIPPAGSYTILNPGNVVTIKKGTNVGYLRVKLNPGNFIGDQFAFGYKIASVSNPGYTISGNTGSGIFAFGIKNKYDGRYTVDGVLVDIIAAANSSTPGDPYPYEVDLVTTGANSVTMFVEGAGYLHLIAGGGAYGEFDPVFTFDGNNNIVSVTNLFGQPSPTRGRSADIDPSGINKYNPGTQTIDVKYFLKQAGALKTTFDEHLTYIGPR